MICRKWKLLWISDSNLKPAIVLTIESYTNNNLDVDQKKKKKNIDSWKSYKTIRGTKKKVCVFPWIPWTQVPLFSITRQNKMANRLGRNFKWAGVNGVYDAIQKDAGDWKIIPVIQNPAVITWLLVWWCTVWKINVSLGIR